MKKIKEILSNKVMEAPEKIYIDPNVYGKNFDLEWYKFRVGPQSVEYTRTDAFTEKAVKWLESNLLHYWDSNTDNFLFDFRKAMED